MKILLFHSGALGDLVNTLPAISALRRRFPGATLTALGRTELLALPLAAGLIDGAVSLESRDLHLLFAPPAPGAGLPASLRQWLGGFDLAVSWVRSAPLADHLRALGLPTHVHPGPFPPPAGVHAADHALLALRGLGPGEPAGPPRLPEPAGGWPGPRFAGIIVHPGSGSRRKNWPAENFARAAVILARQSGLPLAVLSGPADEAAAAETERLLAEGGSRVARFSGLSLPELAGLLASARLVLGNDSGVAHLAGAVGAPTVAVFGPSDPAVWGVRQDHAANLRRSQCPPCFDARRECGTGECFGLSAEEAAEAAMGLLSCR